MEESTSATVSLEKEKDKIDESTENFPAENTPQIATSSSHDFFKEQDIEWDTIFSGPLKDANTKTVEDLLEDFVIVDVTEEVKDNENAANICSSASAPSKIDTPINISEATKKYQVFFHKLIFIAVKEGNLNLLKCLLKFDQLVEYQISHLYKKLITLDQQTQQKHRELEIRKYQAEWVGKFYMNVINLEELNEGLKINVPCDAKQGLLRAYKNLREGADTSIETGQRIQRDEAMKKGEMAEFEKLVAEEISLYTLPEVTLTDINIVTKFLREAILILREQHEKLLEKKERYDFIHEKARTDLEEQRKKWAKEYLKKKIKNWCIIERFASDANPSPVSENEQQQLDFIAALLHADFPFTVTYGETQQSLLHYAVYYQRYDIIKFLLAHGMDLTTPNGEGISALQLIARQGDLEAANLAIQHGISLVSVIAEVDPFGNSLLHHAVQDIRYQGLVGYLVENNADLSLANNANKTPWQLIFGTAMPSYEQATTDEQRRALLGEIAKKQKFNSSFIDLVLHKEQETTQEKSVASTSVATASMEPERSITCSHFFKSVSQDKLTLFKFAETLRAENKLTEAVFYLTKLISDHPNHIHALFSRAKVLTGLARRAEACQDLERALLVLEKKCPQDNKLRAEIYLEIGINYDKRGDIKQGIYYYTLLLALEPRNYMALARRAVLYWKNKQYDLGDADCRAALMINNQDYWLPLNRGEYRFLAQEKYSEALQDYQDALQLSEAARETRGQIEFMIAALKEKVSTLGNTSSSYFMSWRK